MVCGLRADPCVGAGAGAAGGGLAAAGFWGRLAGTVLVTDGVGTEVTVPDGAIAVASGLATAVATAGVVVGVGIDAGAGAATAAGTDGLACATGAMGATADVSVLVRAPHHIPPIPSTASTAATAGQRRRAGAGA
jgi:hypothetical protein